MDQSGPPLTYQMLCTHDTCWDPASVTPTLNITLDACIVPSQATAGARVDTAHLLVLDGFFDEPIRQGLMTALVGENWQGPLPPEDKWERATCDAASMPPTWGLKDSVLRSLSTSPCWAMVEVQSRVAKLWPEAHVAHLPSDAIQKRMQPAAMNPALSQCVAASTNIMQPTAVQTTSSNLLGPRRQLLQPLLAPRSPVQQQLDRHDTASASAQQLALQWGTVPSPREADDDTCAPNSTASSGEASISTSREVEPGVYCAPFVGNAAVVGDAFSWHVDADPWSFPPSPWTLHHGCYVNREPGKPLLVSLLLYLDVRWEREWDAETLFLDTGSDTGVLVRPKPYRAVLMDQDVLHRVSPPSLLAGRPRYSLVWKLALLPRTPQQALTLARPEWGRPTVFGSAAKLASAAQQLAGRKRPVPEASEVK